MKVKHDNKEILDFRARVARKEQQSGRLGGPVRETLHVTEARITQPRKQPREYRESPESRHQRSRAAGAAIGMLGIVVGCAAGNLLPDPTDFVYFLAVKNGSIADPMTAMLVYYVFPGAFWSLIFGIMAAGFYLGWFGIRGAVWLFSGIVISSTILICAIVTTMVVPLLSIIFDIVLSVACVIAVLWVEGRTPSMKEVLDR